jgi:RNA polymerase sigma-70 factor (ECF subfamily)
MSYLGVQVAPEDQENQSDTADQPFHHLLTGAQSSLYAFIYSLLGGGENAHDVLQETNLVLWKKAGEFDSSRKFLPWAFRFAHLQVLAFRKRQQRDHLTFGDGLVDVLATEFTKNVPEAESRLEALDRCLAKLPDPHRNLIRHYYERGSSLAAIGQALGRQAGAVAANLYRIRKALASCIERTLSMEGTS